MASKSTIKFWSTTTYNRFQSSIYLSCLLIVYLSSSFVQCQFINTQSTENFHIDNNHNNQQSISVHSHDFNDKTILKNSSSSSSSPSISTSSIIINTSSLLMPNETTTITSTSSSSTLATTDDPLDRQESSLYHQQQQQQPSIIRNDDDNVESKIIRHNNNGDDELNNVNHGTISMESRKPVVMFAISNDLPKNINNTRKQISHSWSTSSSAVFGLPDSIHSSQPLFSSSIAHHQTFPSSQSTLPASFKLGKKLFRKKVTTSIAVTKPNSAKLQQLITKKEQDPSIFSAIESPRHSYWLSKSNPSTTNHFSHWLKNSTIMENVLQQLPSSIRRRSDQSTPLVIAPPLDAVNVPGSNSQTPKWWWARYLANAVMNHLQQIKPQSTTANQQHTGTPGSEGAESSNSPEYSPMSPEFIDILKAIQTGAVQLNQIELIPDGPPEPMNEQSMFNVQTEIGLPPSHPQSVANQPQQQMIFKEPNRVTYTQSQPVQPMVRHQASMLQHPQYATQSLPQQQQQQYGQIYANRFYHRRSPPTMTSMSNIVMPNRKLYPSSSRLTSSPYSYYAYQQLPIKSGASSFAQSTNNNNKYLHTQPEASSSNNTADLSISQSQSSIGSTKIYQTPSHSTNSDHRSFIPSSSSSSLIGNNFFKQNFLVRPQQQSQRANYHNQDSSDSSPFVVSRIRPSILQTSASSTTNNFQPPIIKFSVKDGVNEKSFASPQSTNLQKSGESRSFGSGSMASTLFDDDLDSSDSQSSLDEPRRIKMGSFLKSRSLWRSGDPSRVILEKYDMSDIFCKTKFKPMINPPSAVLDISRNGRQLKRSSSKNEEQNVASESKPIRFVNSEWTPLAPPKFRLARRLGIQINKDASLENPNVTTIPTTTEIAPILENETVLSRSKRQVAAVNPSELERIIGNLPEGAVIKKIDPATTELLLRLLRNTNASDDIERKKITKVYYIYLAPKANGNSANLFDQNSTLNREESPPPLANIDYQRNRQPAPYQENFPVNRLNYVDTPRRRPLTTTTTTTTEAPILTTSQPKFVLNEQDYEYGEILCEGRFNGGVPDFRNDCRLYFECNPQTIDTYACPEDQRYDMARQLCVPEREAYCPQFSPSQSMSVRNQRR
uniref:Transcriptional regulator DEF1-like isoform X1 n=1 Tax=Dermatophagoides pteronyssinus TaxID=6956 RepID=A0A6P6YLY6_DERPT|nr:transcriptional regulator DEF1-like isoform X1 [Dermatophagoides pteronyssinus]